MFLRLEQLKQNQRTFGSVDGDFIKSNRTKNTSKMLRYLLGLIYYSNTIFGNISGKNKIISLYAMALKTNFFSFNFRFYILAILSSSLKQVNNYYHGRKVSIITNLYIKKTLKKTDANRS